MFLHVIRAEYIADYRIWLRFNDGREGEVNLEHELWGEVFEPLRNKRLFAKVHLNKETKTIVWENGADFAPEFLHELLEPVYQAEATSQPSRLAPALAG
jgi:hypothetical protein